MSEERKIPTITFNKLNSFQQTLIRHSIIFKPQAKPYIVISQLNTMDEKANQKHKRSFSVSREDSNSKAILTAMALTIATLSCYQAIFAHKNITTGTSYKSYHILLKNLSDLLIKLTLEILNIDKKSQETIWKDVPTNLINLLSDLRIRTEKQLIEKRELNQKSDLIKAREDFQSQLLAIVDALQQRFIQVVLSINPNIEENFFSFIRDLLISTDREISQNINFNKTLDYDALTKEFTQLLTKITGQAIKIRDSKNYFEPVSKTHEHKPETRTEEEIKQYGGLPNLTQLPVQSYQKIPKINPPSF